MKSEIVRSNQAIAHNILMELKKYGYKYFTARPWNYYKPDTTLWWLVPSTQWPSYKYGKIYVSSSNGTYEIGLNVEKGIGPIAGQMLPYRTAQKLCIQDDWIWHRFLEDLKSDKLHTILERISREKKKPLTVLIQASTIEDKDSRAQEFEGLELNNRISFQFNNGVLTCLKDEAKGELRKYDYINSLESLVDLFEAKDMEWFWIDLYIYFVVDETEMDQSIDLACGFIEAYSDLFLDNADTSK